MALTSTVYRFAIDLSHVDRNVYDKLDLRVAQHPSETKAFMVTRVLAFAFLCEDGLAFSKGGLSDADAPALATHSLDGQLRTWVEIGVPSGDRLHKASKAAPRVVVFTHKNPQFLAAEIASRDIYRKEQLELYAVSEALVAELAEAVDRNNGWQLTFSDGQIYVSAGEQSWSGTLTKL